VGPPQLIIWYLFVLAAISPWEIDSPLLNGLLSETLLRLSNDTFVVLSLNKLQLLLELSHQPLLPALPCNQKICTVVFK
jgi:hypothetical protein